MNTPLIVFYYFITIPNPIQVIFNDRAYFDGGVLFDRSNVMAAEAPGSMICGLPYLLYVRFLSVFLGIIYFSGATRKMVGFWEF